MISSSKLMPIVRRVAELAVLGGMAGAAFGVVTHVSRADADGNPATDAVPRVFAYEGRLEFNGQPFNGSASIAFSVYDGAGAATPVWTETQTIAVYNGSFSATLGTSTPLGNLAANADDLYVGITVDGVALAGRQRLVPAPFALWATTATNLQVGNDATVARDLFVSRNANVTGSFTLAGALNLPTGSVTSGFVADNSLTVNDLAPDSVGSSELAADAAGTSEIAADAVGNSELAPNSVTSAELVDSTVASADILDGTVASADIADGTVSRTDLAGTEIAVYRGLAGCGESSSTLTLNGQCNSETCAIGLFENCSGVCASTMPQMCDRPVAGYLVAP